MTSMRPESHIDSTNSQYELSVTHSRQSNGVFNKEFLNLLDAGTKSDILNSIASHYGVSADVIYEEITESEAELLYEYMVEPNRAITFVLMKRYGFA